MAREHARIHLAMWADGDFRDLPAESQWLYLYLLTSPALTYAGVTDWRPTRIAPMAVDVSPGRVDVAAVELEQRHYIVVDRDTEEVLIRTFIRHDGLMNQPNVAAAMVTAYRAIASQTLQAVVVHELIRLRKDDEKAKTKLRAWDGKTARDDVLELLTFRSMTPEQALEVLPQNLAGFPSEWGHNEPETSRSNPSGNPSVRGSVYPSVTGSGNPSPNPSGNPSVNPCPTPSPSPSPTPNSKSPHLRNSTSPETQKPPSANCPDHPEHPAGRCPICARQATVPAVNWRSA